MPNAISILDMFFIHVFRCLSLPYIYQTYSHIADLFFLRGQAANLDPSFFRFCPDKNGGRHEHNAYEHMS